MSHTSRRSVLAALTAAPTALFLAACGGEDSSSGSGTSSASSGSESTASGSTSASSSSEASAADGAYKAGDYDAEGSYQTPGGQQSVEVKMTLTGDGTVSKVEVVPQAESGNSVQFQGKFASGISGEVTGKKIDDLQVSKVSGSSLTSGGFNAAVEKIKSEAKA